MAYNMKINAGFCIFNHLLFFVHEYNWIQTSLHILFAKLEKVTYQYLWILAVHQKSTKNLSLSECYAVAQPFNEQINIVTEVLLHIHNLAYIIYAFVL